MKPSQSSIITLSLALAAFTHSLRSDIVIPGANGADGALNITADTVIDLSKAVSGEWSDTLNAANAGKGIYDSNKWAVVFKYTEVTIASGAKVTFKNHPSRAPLVWLVQGNVAINGDLSLDGEKFTEPPLLAEPGPGGFRGGTGRYSDGATESPGFGPGGGGAKAGNTWGEFGGGGSYGSVGFRGQPVYGNPSLIPLIGGSGGGGRNAGFGTPGWGGGGGGGAILIASGGTVSVNGMIHSNGGDGNYRRNMENDFAGGSGGGIRIVCDTLAGTGVVQCLGGVSTIFGGLGRIRVERVSTSNSWIVTPDPSVVDIASGSSAILWPPSGSPEVRIVSIGGADAPPDPRAAFGTLGADVAIPITSSTAVIVETRNVEQASEVLVRGTPRMSGNYSETKATVASIVSTDPLVIRWTAALPVQAGYSAVQVRVIRP